MSEVKQIGNYETESTWDNPQTGRVYSADGISPTLNTCNGGDRQPKIVEPMIVASHRTPGADTEQRLEPNSEGICNTLTSVQKDNLVLEPLGGIYTNASADFQRGMLVGMSRCLKANQNDAGVVEKVKIKQATKEGYIECKLGGVKDNLVLEPAILTPKRTEYGKAIRKAYESGVIQESRHNMTELQPRTDGISNTLTTVQKDNLLLEPKLVGGLGEKDWGSQWRQGNRVYDSNAVAMALNSQPVGNTGGNSYLYSVQHENSYRIRKLTPLECWKLMDFTEVDFRRAEAVNSNTQLYKQAGNSIVKAVLMAIFKQMMQEGI